MDIYVECRPGHKQIVKFAIERDDGSLLGRKIDRVRDSGENPTDSIDLTISGGKPEIHLAILETLPGVAKVGTIRPS